MGHVFPQTQGHQGWVSGCALFCTKVLWVGQVWNFGGSGEIFSSESSWVLRYPDNVPSQPQGFRVYLRPGSVLLSNSPKHFVTTNFRPDVLFPSVLRSPGWLPFSPVPAASIHSSFSTPSSKTGCQVGHITPGPLLSNLPDEHTGPHINEGFPVNTLGKTDKLRKSCHLGGVGDMTGPTQAMTYPKELAGRQVFFHIQLNTKKTLQHGSHQGAGYTCWTTDPFEGLFLVISVGGKDAGHK